MNGLEADTGTRYVDFDILIEDGDLLLDYAEKEISEDDSKETKALIRIGKQIIKCAERRKEIGGRK